MAGAQATVTVNDREVINALTQLYAKWLTLERPFKVIGAKLVASTQQRFEVGRDPLGNPWTPLADATQQRKVTKTQRRGADHILIDRGHLVGSITYLASAQELAVGTNKVYGALHQFGGTPDMPPGPAAVPARPYLGVSPDDETEILNVLTDYLAGAL